MRKLEEEFKRWSFRQPGWKIQLHCGDVHPYVELLHETEDSRGLVAQHKDDVLTISFREQVPMFMLADERIIEQEFGNWLRRIIHSAVLHEADEWITKDGTIVWDPHRENEAMTRRHAGWS